MESYKGINFKRTKDVAKIEYIKHGANGVEVVKPAKFGNIEIIEFRSGREGGDFDTIDLELRDVEKFKSFIQQGEFLEIIPYYEYDGEFHKMCKFYAAHLKDRDALERIFDIDRTCGNGDIIYGHKGGSWCYQF